MVEGQGFAKVIRVSLGCGIEFSVKLQGANLMFLAVGIELGKLAISEFPESFFLDGNSGVENEVVRSQCGGGKKEDESQFCALH